MAITTPVRFERALLVDGVFCVVAGLLVAARADELADDLGLPSDWLPAVAGLVTVAWGIALVLAARYRANRNVLRLVAAVNAMVAAGGVLWLVLDGSAMSDAGRAVVAFLTLAVAAFAAWDLWLLRRRR